MSNEERSDGPARSPASQFYKKKLKLPPTAHKHFSITPFLTTTNRYTNFVFYQLSLLVKSMTNRHSQFVCIFMMNSYNARMMGTGAMSCTKAMIDVVQKCFPERVKR